MKQNWNLEIWTVKEFASKSSKINCNPVGQRPSVSPNPIGGSKPSKQQSIMNTILKGGDIGEIKLVKEPLGECRYESIDGGNRKRTILSYLSNKFPTHKSSVLGEKYARDLPSDILEGLLNYAIRFVIYDEMSVREKGETFRDTNNTTPVNQQETLNSYGDIPIANLIRQTARKVEGITSLPHELFTSYLTKSDNEVFPNISTDNKRLRLDEHVARIAYMIYAGSKPVVAPFESLQSMYDDTSLTEKEVNKIEKKLKTVLDFILNCSMQRRQKVKRGVTNGEIVMLYRLYFHFKDQYKEFKIESYEAFWSEFKKAFDVFNPKRPLRKDLVENNRLIHEAFNQHLGEHKTQYKFDNTIKWMLEEMDLEKATVLPLDGKRTFTREEIELKLAEQGFRCWVTGEYLDMSDAQGGHIIAHSKGGLTEYDNLVVISSEHNRRMQDMNAHDYKKMYLETLSEAA